MDLFCDSILKKWFQAREEELAIIDENDKEFLKHALVIFTEDVGKSEFIQMIKEEKSENIKTELLHNMPMLLKEKERFFSEVEIGELF